MRYGDQLLSEERWCDAVTQYESAQAIGALDAAAQEGYERAYVECYPPTPTIDPATLFTPTIDPALLTTTPPTATVATEPSPPTEVPTEPPAATQPATQ
jgi:hypothetical protein